MKIVFVLFVLLFSFMIVTLSSAAWAARGSSGSMSVGVMGGFVNSEQTHLNTLRVRANQRAGGIAASDLERAYEFGPFIQWRAGMLGFQLRPSYFMQEEGSGAYEYSTTGYAVEAHFKLYPLESQEVKLFFETGVAYGNQKTSIKEDTFTVDAEGSNLGYLIGLGVEILWGPHAVVLEGGWRYLPIERNIVTSSNGTPAADSVSQYTTRGELEYDQRDLSTNMSGTKMMVGYAYNF
ncbi:MAG: hypothetical protein HYV97_00905 [Bdellovibrio sp.]|nr:hypothetical protein [Bdellovibrio sp.]